jgi:hypothetical protein
MSHRVTNETEMKNKELAVAAITAAGLSFRAQGESRLVITSGRLANAVLDLGTGVITGDSDHGHTRETLGMLKQHYGEAMYRAECAKTGVEIFNRSVEEATGDVILHCRAAFG